MKIAVVGTSNTGALKYAAPQIAQDFPSVDLTFYGLPARKFDRMRCKKGVFGPRRADHETVALSRRINGVPRLDLTQFDHVLVVADTLGLNPTLWLAAQNDIVNWPARRGRPLMSEPAFVAAMTDSIAVRADHLLEQFGDIRLHVAPAPYPTTGVIPPGKMHRYIFASIAQDPEAARIEKIYTAELRHALTARNITLIAQPADTIAQPFLTHEPYGHGALDFRKEGATLDDHRHLNADFGASLFRAFALAIGLTPNA